MKGHLMNTIVREPHVLTIQEELAYIKTLRAARISELHQAKQRVEKAGTALDAAKIALQSGTVYAERDATFKVQRCKSTYIKVVEAYKVLEARLVEEEIATFER
jgi:hypothetical protein